MALFVTTLLTGGNAIHRGERMARLYALLVGINAYDDSVGKLRGCLNDIENVHRYLKDNWPEQDLAIEFLRDEEATRPNVIRQFRDHLGRAGPGDTALFHYCGHGARARSAPEFLQFFPEGKDEGLVCIDSRRDGGFDLADKELAVMIGDVAARDPHVAIVLDCCHSGSGTRDADEFVGFLPRLAQEAAGGRELETYIDGYYAAAQRRGETLSIPGGRHILLAACERFQTAKESPDRSGVFTTALMQVLRAASGTLTYPELFTRARAAARSLAQDQDPQFETAGGFDGWSGFLGRQASANRQRFDLLPHGGGWQIECGATNGIPSDADRQATFTIFPDAEPERSVGGATAVRVGAQLTDLLLDFTPDPHATYRAQLTSLPVPPMLVGFNGDSAMRAALEAALAAPSADPVALTDAGEERAHTVSLEDGALVLRQRGTGTIIQRVPVRAGQDWVAPTVALLGHVARWERMLALGNAHPQLDPAIVDFRFSEIAKDGAVIAHPGEDVTVRYSRRQGSWQPVLFKLQVANCSAQTLHLALVHFSPDYGIDILRNDEVPAASGDVTFLGDDEAYNLFLEDGETEVLERFRLIVSTERVDDFLLAQDPLAMGKEVSANRGLGVGAVNKPVENDWFVKDLSVRVLRGLDRAGPADIALAGGRIVVRAHSSVSADISLTQPAATTRGIGDNALINALADQGISLLDAAGARDLGGSVIELTGISNAGDLTREPLELVLDMPLADNEFLLPLTIDAGTLSLAGQPCRDEDGRIVVRIDGVSENAGSRDVGSALKLFLFKTILPHREVNELRWLDKKAAGAPALTASGLPEKVAEAQSILLVLHDILGDGQGMAQAMQASGLDAHFDLVLAYDYENLSTPVEEAARSLLRMLTAVGLDCASPPRLTIIGHGLGGLVARWLTEQEGAAAMVRHLVLCGTPNHGSPLGDIDRARKLVSLLTGVAVKFFPALAPYNAALLFAINQSKKLTPTLEQMKAGSPLLSALAASADPGIRVTLLAGDVAGYREPDGGYLANLLLSAGQGFPLQLLFGGRPHDLVTSDESALGLPDRIPSPERVGVPCHHLNYFSSLEGRTALTGLGW